MKISDLLFFRWSKTTAPPPPPPPPIDGISAEKNYWESLKERKELCLVINLETLIDSIDRRDYTKYDMNYFSKSSVSRSFKEGQLGALLYPLEITIKLRPYIRSFLKDMHSRYRIVLFSKRSPSYVDVIHRILDPNGANKLTMISLQSPKSTHQLKSFLSNQELLVIVDDTEKGWQNKYWRNIVKVGPYAYFSRVKMKKHVHKSWTQLKGDECETGGELYRISHRLRGIRNIFYDPRYGDFQDVRQVIRKFRCNNCDDLYGICHDLSR